MCHNVYVYIMILIIHAHIQYNITYWYESYSSNIEWLIHMTVKNDMKILYVNIAINNN